MNIILNIKQYIIMLWLHYGSTNSGPEHLPPPLPVQPSTGHLLFCYQNVARVGSYRVRRIPMVGFAGVQLRHMEQHKH